jgi:hypothetical protein
MLTGVYLLTVGVGSWLIGRPEHPAPRPPAGRARRSLMSAGRQPPCLGMHGSAGHLVAWAARALLVLCAGGRLHRSRRSATHCRCTSCSRYLVLDATSMLFLLVINAVFLGISVYMLARQHLAHHGREDPAARGAVAGFMLAMNLGVMANHLLVLWAFIELTTLCAGAAGGAGRVAPARGAWPGTTCCTPACRWR